MGISGMIARHGRCLSGTEGKMAVLVRADPKRTQRRCSFLISVDVANLKVRQLRRPMLIATLAILAAGADAQVHDPPLFAAFKAFCVDTGARPDAVKSAVEAAGGKQHAPPGATAWPFPMTVTSWDITTGGHSLSVSAGTQQAPPVQNRPGENSNQCIMRSFVNEDASIEAIRSWVGVPLLIFRRAVRPATFSIIRNWVPFDRHCQRLRLLMTRQRPQDAFGHL